jgi:hypothetical protein
MGTESRKISRKTKKDNSLALEALRPKPFFLTISERQFECLLDFNGLACMQEEAAKYLRNKPIFDDKGIPTGEYAEMPMNTDDVLLGATNGDQRCLSIMLWASAQYKSDMSYREFSSLITLQDITAITEQMLKIVASLKQTIGSEEDRKNAAAPKTSKKKTTKKKQAGA